MSLQSLIKKNTQKPMRLNEQGILVEDTQEGIQTLAQNAGISPPTSPIGGAMIGANKDQQKMLGTPAQKQAAQNISAQNQDTLRTSQKSGLTGTQASSKLQEQKALADSLSGSQAAAQKLINTQLESLQKQQAQVPTSGTFTAAEGQNQAIVDNSFQALISALGSGKPANSPEVQQQLIQLMNSTGLSQDDILKKVQELDVSSIAGKAAAAGTQDTITGAQLLPELGVPAAQVASLLGIPEQEVLGMSVSELTSRIDRKLEEETTFSQNLQQQAQSGLLSTSERRAAREQAVAADVGLVSLAEKQIQDLGDKIATGGTVTLGGTEYKVEDLLKDSQVSKLVTDYLAGAAPELAGTPLAAFAEQYREAFKETTKQVQEVSKASKDIQAKNQVLSKVGSSSIDPKLMESLAPGITGSMATTVERQSIPLLRTLDSLPTGVAEGMVQGMNAIVKQHPEQAAVFSGLKEEDIRYLANNPTQMQNLLRNLDKKKQFDNLPDGDIDSIIEYLFDGEVSPGLSGGSGAQAMLDQAAAARAITGGTPSSWEGFLDQNRDGKLDDPKSIKDRIQGPAVSKNLRQLDWGNVREKVVPPPILNTPVYSILEQVAQDGRITRKEADDLVPTLDDVSLGILINTPGIVDKNAGSSLSNAIKVAINNRTDGMVESIIKGEVPNEEIQSLLRNPPPYLDAARIQDAIKQYEESQAAKELARVSNSLNNIRLDVDRAKDVNTFR